MQLGHGALLISTGNRHNKGLLEEHIERRSDRSPWKGAHFE